MGTDFRDTDGYLSILTKDGKTVAKVEGDNVGILFNWLVLTSEVCVKTGIPPAFLSFTLLKEIQRCEDVRIQDNKTEA